MQKVKSEKTFQLFISRELSVTIAKAQLKTLCLPSNAIKLIIDIATTKHPIKTGALRMHNINGFHHLIDR